MRDTNNHAIRLFNKKKTPQDLKNTDNEDNSLFFFKSLELKGVNYNYPSNNSLIVKGYNLNIKGETVGIKGKTGSGKSTQ